MNWEGWSSLVCTVGAQVFFGIGSWRFTDIWAYLDADFELSPNRISSSFFFLNLFLVLGLLRWQCFLRRLFLDASRSKSRWDYSLLFFWCWTFFTHDWLSLLTCLWWILREQLGDSILWQLRTCQADNLLFASWLVLGASLNGFHSLSDQRIMHYSSFWSLIRWNLRLWSWSRQSCFLNGLSYPCLYLDAIVFFRLCHLYIIIFNFWCLFVWFPSRRPTCRLSFLTLLIWLASLWFSNGSISMCLSLHAMRILVMLERWWSNLLNFLWSSRNFLLFWLFLDNWFVSFCLSCHLQFSSGKLFELNLIFKFAFDFCFKVLRWCCNSTRTASINSLQTLDFHILVS